MKKSNGKFFIGIGILLVIAGIVLFPDDQIIGIIGAILGIYNIVKGVRLLRGIQPMLIRKQQERTQQIDDELKNRMNDNASPTQKKRNHSNNQHKNK